MKLSLGFRRRFARRPVVGRHLRESRVACPAERHHHDGAARCGRRVCAARQAWRRNLRPRRGL